MEGDNLEGWEGVSEGGLNILPQGHGGACRQDELCGGEGLSGAQNCSTCRKSTVDCGPYFSLALRFSRLLFTRA